MKQCFLDLIELRHMGTHRCYGLHKIKLIIVPVLPEKIWAVEDFWKGKSKFSLMTHP